MSSRPFFLLSLCFVSALALNAYAALDPTGVYQDYLEKLDAATPPVAAMATAAADGVYPWSEPKAPEPPPVPDPAPLPDPEPEPEPEEAELPGKQTLAQALSGKHYGKIYLMLGINELGTGTAESWAAQYKVLLDEVRELQPDAIIFLQAIFHTTQEKSDATFFKNSTIDARNAELQKLADNETVFYIDCNPVFDDSTGALTPEYSGDGVHVKAAYYPMWRDYLFQFGVVR